MLSSSATEYAPSNGTSERKTSNGQQRFDMKAIVERPTDTQKQRFTSVMLRLKPCNAVPDTAEVILVTTIREKALRFRHG